jgi:predicted dehydrogenase
MSLQLDGGIIGSVALGRIGAASHPSGGEVTIHVVGTEGAMAIDESAPGVTVCYRGQPAKEPRRRRVANDYDFLLADDLARAIEGGGETVMGIRASHAIYATVEAALRSGQTGEVVDVV